MYGADGLPLMLDQSWFSIRMRNTVWMGQAPEQVAGRVVVVVLAVVEVGEGHVNGPQGNPQLMSPTSHCAILRASSMLQAPSPLTSHASGCASWLHWRTPTSNSATISASPMLTTPSPFTSPQRTAASLAVIGEAALPKEAVASRRERERPAARSPRAGKRKASSFAHLPHGEQGLVVARDLPSVKHSVTGPMAARRDDFLHGATVAARSASQRPCQPHMSRASFEAHPR